MSIDLRCCGAEELIASLEPGSVAGVIADPPWTYDSARTGGRGKSGPAHLYPVLGVPEIAETLMSTAAVVGSDAYLAVWCTWPKLADWFAVGVSRPWSYLTGGSWGKSGAGGYAGPNGYGMGYHFRGRSEPLLLHRKGRPRPLGGPTPNLWLHPRLGHSEKPPNALDALVLMMAPPGGLILDPYAGESASLARCCARLGRGYVGAEIDPERHARALRRLAGESAAQSRMRNQTSMFGAEVMPAPGTEVEPLPGYGYGMGRPPERMTDDEQAAVMRRLRKAGE